MAFTLSEIAVAVHGSLKAAPGSALDQPLRIETDSRQVAGQCLFWALHGENFDGHDFVEQAIAAGAVACVIEAGHQPSKALSVPVIEVEDSLQALTDLAIWHRSRLAVKVIGITGSYGKTTTRQMVAAALSARLRVFQSKKNFNNHIGLPLCLFDLSDDYDVAVLELGASAVGDIKRLCEIAMPEWGIITGIGRAHSMSFGGLLQTRLAKGELAQALPVDGKLFLSSDEPQHPFLAGMAQCDVQLLGSGYSDDLRVESITQRGNRLQLRVDGHDYRVECGGSHFARNALFAIGVARELGLTPAEIAAGLATHQSAPGRCEVRDLGPWIVIDDTYNASPEAMVAACRALGRWPTEGHRIFVCGDMLELGEDNLSGHQDVGVAVVEAGLDVVLAFGFSARTVVETAVEAGLLPENSGCFTDMDELLERLKSELNPGDVVLVKGSRSMRMERVVEWLVNEAEVMCTN